MLQPDQIADYLKQQDAGIDALLAVATVRINIGCGINRVDGYINVDVQEAKGGVVPDIFADARNVPLPDACADEVMAIHVFEHFALWECGDVLAEWRRLLKMKGLLVLELPDIIKCCRNVVEGIEGDKHPDQLGLWGIYGDAQTPDPYMLHRWGWSPKSLRHFLHQHGFKEAEKKETQHHAVGRQRRDMRIEARKA